MSRKTLFWIAFFALTLVEIGQLAYSNEQHVTVITNDSQVTSYSEPQDNTETLSLKTNI